MYYQKSESLDRYFKSIKNLDPLTKAEEIDLARKAQAGSKAALNKLVQHNLKIVVTIANKNRGRGIDVDDLIQQGNIGLYEAVHRFDPDSNTRLASFASTRILKMMNELIDQCGRIVRLPVNQEYQRYLAIKNGEEVDNLNTVKMDDYMSSESTTTRADYITHVEPSINSDHDREFFRRKVNSLLSTLEDRDRTIIRLYYGLETGAEVPTKEIADRIGITQVRVCQILKAAKETLKENYQLSKTL
tara:strand:+ start:355 stop:1089 length:735 start_codon:yes stop_codon:yes gene_type:complete